MKICNLAGNHLKNPTRVKIKSIKNTEKYPTQKDKNRIRKKKKDFFAYQSPDETHI